MKSVIILSLIFFSFSSFADLNCDWRVSTEELTQSSYTEQVVGKGSLKADNAEYRMAENLALQDCISQGGVNCKVERGASICVYNKNSAAIMSGIPFFKPDYTCDAVAVGAKLVLEKNLSTEVINERKQKLICLKIEDCKVKALNDVTADSNFMQKLEIIYQTNNCSR